MAIRLHQLVCILHSQSRSYKPPKHSRERETEIKRCCTWNKNHSFSDPIICEICTLLWSGLCPINTDNDSHGISLHTWNKGQKKSSIFFFLYTKSPNWTNHLSYWKTLIFLLAHPVLSLYTLTATAMAFNCWHYSTVLI